MNAEVIGLIGAMEEEVSLLRSRLKELEESRLGPLSCYTGILEGKRVVLVRSGIGKTNAAIATALLLERYRPRFVINTGSAGGLAAKLSIGDLVISDRALYHDVDVSAFGYEPGQIPGLSAVFNADPALIDLAERSINALKAETVIPAEVGSARCSILSGDTFLGDDRAKAALSRRFPDAGAVEMEGAAIAQTCVLFQVPFVILRAISDVAGKQSWIDFNDFLPLAAERSSLIVERIIREA